jgi:predicted RNA-binding Zn ribbon-like protein
MDEQRKAGWYDDPQGVKRYWDGADWTDKVTGGVRGPMSSGDIAIGILLAALVLGAVFFGALNFLSAFGGR